VLQADGRLLVGTVALADEAGPHGVMKFGKVAMTMFSAHNLEWKAHSHLAKKRRGRQWEKAGLLFLSIARPKWHSRGR
jgi:hypothetical protein